MIYDLFWIDFLIASLLLVAASAAIAGHFPRKWMRGLLEGILSLVPVTMLISPAGVAGALFFTAGFTHRWMADPLIVLAAFFVGDVLICYVGRQKKTASRPASANWPRLPLVFAFFVTGVVAYLILVNIAVVARTQLVLVDQRLSLTYQASEPALTADSQNAAPLYQIAYARLRRDPGKDVTNPPLGDAENFNADEPATIAFLARQAGTISLLRQAATLPVYRYPIDSATPNMAMLKAMIDDLNSERGPAEILSLEAREQVAHGNVPAAVSDVDAIFKMSRQFAQRPLFTPALVGMGIDGLGAKTLEKILPSVKGPHDLAGLHFDQLSSLPHLFQNALRSEERFGLSSFASFPWNNSTWGNGSKIELMPAYVTPAGMVFQDSFIDIDNYLSAMDDLQADVIQPYYLVKDKLPRSDNRRLGLVAQIILPGLDRGLETNAKAQANNACARTAIAMTLYRLDHGSLPTRLLDVVPKYLDAIPTDPFNGQPLRLVIKNKNYIIYSVGPNAIDDGGFGYDKTNKAKDDVSFTLYAAPLSATTKP